VYLLVRGASLPLSFRRVGGLVYWIACAAVSILYIVWGHPHKVIPEFIVPVYQIYPCILPSFAYEKRAKDPFFDAAVMLSC